MNFARRTHRAKGMPIQRLPLVAFIDIVLFLLLYFVVIFDASPTEGRLPSALGAVTGGRTASGLQPQVLTIVNDAGTIAYVIGERRFTSQQALTSLLARLPSEAGLFVRVPGDAPIDAVASAMQAARDAGFARISYVPAETP